MAETLGPQCTAFPYRAGWVVLGTSSRSNHLMNAYNQVGLCSIGFFCLSDFVMWGFQTLLPLKNILRFLKMLLLVLPCSSLGLCKGMVL